MRLRDGDPSKSAQFLSRYLNNNDPRRAVFEGLLEELTTV